MTSWVLYFSRRFQRAIDHIRASKDDDPMTHAYLALSYAGMSRFEDALVTADELRASTKDPDVLAQVVAVYVLGGKSEVARAILDEIASTADPYFRAVGLDHVNETQAALALLEDVVAAKSDRALLLKIDSFSPGLRSHAHFQALLKKVGFPA